MRMHRTSWLGLTVVTLIVFAPRPVAAQGTVADYERALGLRKQYDALVGNAVDAPHWLTRSHRLWYRRTIKGGHDFILVDADTKARGPAFDHARIAASLSTATGKLYTALELPFNTLDFVDGDRAIQFVADANTWRCTIADAICRKATPAELQQGGGRGGRGGGGRGAGQGAPGFAGRGGAAEEAVRVSPDGRTEALIWNYNVSVRDAATKKNERALSFDGSEGNAYQFNSIVWSPDSKQNRRQPRQARLPARSALRRIVAGGPAPAEALDQRVCEAGRPARSSAAGDLRRRRPSAKSRSTARSSPIPTICRGSSGARTATR